MLQNTIFRIGGSDSPTLAEVESLIDASADLLQAEIDALDVALQAEIDALDASLSADITALDVSLSADISALDAELTAEINTVSENLYVLENGGLSNTKSETLINFNNLTGYSTYYTYQPTAFTAVGFYRDANGFWRSDVSFNSLAGDYSGFTVTFVNATATGDGGDGLTIATAKKNIGSLMTDATNRLLVVKDCGYDIKQAIVDSDWETVRLGLKSGFAQLNSASAGGNDIGANKIIVPWEIGNTVLLTGFYSTSDMTWSTVSSGIYKSTSVTSTPGGLLDFGQMDIFNQPVRAIAVTSTTYVVTGVASNGAGGSRITTTAAHGLSTGNQVVIYNTGGATYVNGEWTVTVITSTTFDIAVSFGASITTPGTLVNLSALVAPQVSLVNSVLYYASTVAPSGANTFVSVNSTRYRHNNPDRRLVCRDTAFLGGSVTFSSVCGQLITSATNSSGNYLITTSAAHDFSVGDVVLLDSISGAASGLNGTHTIATVPTTTTFTVPVVYTNNSTSNTGVAVRPNKPQINGFFDCIFGFGFSSTSNVTQFEGHGLTVLKGCALISSSTDIIDYRCRRYAIEDNCWFKGAGAQNSSSNLNQNSTGHSGSRVISVGCEYNGAYGPLIQDVREYNVDSYRVVAGSWMYNSIAASTTSRVGIFSGTSSSTTDASIFWALDNRFTDRLGANAMDTRYTVCLGSSYYTNQITTLKNTQGTPAADSIAII